MLNCWHLPGEVTACSGVSHSSQQLQLEKAEEAFQ